jgi:hypothetical protein
MPNCTCTACVTGVVMLPIVIDPLVAFPATHAAKPPPFEPIPVAMTSCMRGLFSGQFVNGA